MTERKVAFITGASRGIGRGCALELAQRGFDLVLTARTVTGAERYEHSSTVKRSAVEPLPGSLEQTAEEVRALGAQALVIKLDLSVRAEWPAAVQGALEHFGRIDVLVNNAGLSPLYPSLDAVTEALFDKVIGVNLKGPFRISALACTRMAKDNGGAVINVSSLAAIRPDPTSLPYAAAKAGLNALTEGLAQAFAPSVRVNAIQCGPFLTDVADAWTPEIKQAAEERVALGRCGEVDDVVGAALFFATNASAYCTGTILRLDGGAR